MYRLICLFFLLTALVGCDDSPSLWNNPYPHDADESALYLSFTESPKRLDPAGVYLANEIHIVSQIYEPPLQYHYLLRPYQLIPQTLTQLPEVRYLNSAEQPLPANAADADIAYTVYTLQLKPGILYQPHPAFAQDKHGDYLYHGLSPEVLANISSINDFAQTGTRELVAEDYVYQIKRLALPGTFSPILTFMQEYIVGLDDYAKQLNALYAQQPVEPAYIDLRQYPLAGVVATDRYTYQIKINGKYPQFLNWLAMHFFAPMPWEAEVFYQQAGLAERNISINWVPVGTGPYMLTDNDPNQRMVLLRNPYYHEETFPTAGMPDDQTEDLLRLAGARLPLLNSVVYTLEKESVPQWSKFLQGYYDYLRLDTDTFEQAVQLDAEGLALSKHIKDRHLKLYNRSSAAVYYWGFNMLDPVVGGYSERARKLRKALSLVVDMQEFVNIFLNGLAEVGSGPIPPDIFGYAIEQELAADRAACLSMDERINQAKQLLREAGYPDGRDAITGKPLVLNYDTVTKGAPDTKSRLGWMRKQFAKLGVALEVRATQLGRFQQKMRTGEVQLFFFTWIGDYPDPENFLFLFYGPSSVAVSGGSNRSNYQNAEYDKLFNLMKNMDDTPERATIIKKMLQILAEDMPWFAEIYPSAFTVGHGWVYPMKPSDIVRNTIKYQKVDVKLRAEKRSAWNIPLFWPVFSLVFFMISLALPVVVSYYRKQFKKPRKE